MNAVPLDALAIAQMLRDSPWMLPAARIAHIAGFTLLVGCVAVFDLRVMGLSKAIGVRALARHTLPWSVAALALIVPTGLVMFAAKPDDFLASGVFQAKMALIIAAGMNAAYFLTGPYAHVRAWDTGTPAPVDAKLSAVLSLALWLAVIACGVMLRGV